MATSQTQGALSPWGSRGPQNSWKSPEAKCGDGQLLGADVGTLRPHRGCSNTAPLIFPGRQLQPLHSAWFAEAKLLRSDVADLERPFWGSSQTHTHVHAPKHTCLCTHTCTCVCTQTCVCAHGHTCTDTCTCAHTHTDAYLGRAERGRLALDGTVAAGYPPLIPDSAVLQMWPLQLCDWRAAWALRLTSPQGSRSPAVCSGVWRIERARQC